jgi:hypothetical protein
VNESKFIGVEYRLHWFEFEDKALVNANGIEYMNMFPLSIEFNPTCNELVIVTKSDLRLVNIRNGQIIKILANIVKEDDNLR